MAEDKNSIIVYADWIDKFEELSDDEAGRLIKHFFRYVNDLNPDAPDRITKLSFIDIEKSLKRDLKKWELIKGKRSEAGKASAEARRLAKEQEKPSTKSTHVESVNINSTNPTVSVNGSVNDNVSVNVINTKEEGFAFTEKKSELIDALVLHFGFSEMRFDNNKRQIFQFVNSQLKNEEEITHFMFQFQNYHNYKTLSKEKLHNFTGLLGTPAMHFNNSAWNSENWEQKIINFNKANKEVSKFEANNNIFDQLKAKRKNGNPEI